MIEAIGHKHDFSAFDAEQERINAAADAKNQASLAPVIEARGRAEAAVIQAIGARRLRTGAAVFLAGLGVGVAAFGISYLIEVRSIASIVDRPAAQKQIAADPPLPAPKVGEQATQSQFTGSQDYQRAVVSGKIMSHKDGIILFDNGKYFINTLPDGSHDTSFSNSRHDGVEAYCVKSNEKFPNGAEKWPCYALHKGIVETTETVGDR